MSFVLLRTQWQAPNAVLGTSATMAGSKCYAGNYCHDGRLTCCAGKECQGVEQGCSLIKLKGVLQCRFDEEITTKHQWVGRGADGFPSLEGNTSEVVGNELIIRYSQYLCLSYKQCSHSQQRSQAVTQEVNT